MTYTPFDYQEAAITECLERLSRAIRSFRDPDYQERRAFALAACTGAGKTVIASKVLEALLIGSDATNTVADPSITVLWVTDDEALNAQTRQRFVSASRLNETHLNAIDNENFDPVLARGAVHFLNVQKLHDKSTNYTVASDARPYTLWDTISRTAEDSTLIVVLDEAHKGMKSNGERATTVRRLISGEGARKPVPVVWGISATPERFKDALGASTTHIPMPDVVVDTAAVQASGLLKDTIILSAPEDDGAYDTTMLREAVRRVREQETRWADYCAAEGIDTVVPLMVVQVGNKPSAAELNRVVSVIREEWKAGDGDVLDDKHIRHVFGDRTDIKADKLTIKHIAPETVQDNTNVRVLLAIEAITTGWDCPRAEVLVSLRGGKDRTHITQLIGRMVRTPLARRVDTDEMLNAVTCLLPKFDATTTDAVVAKLTARDFGDGDAPVDADRAKVKVLRDPVALGRNPNVPADVFDALAGLPTEIRPVGAALRPITALFETATALTEFGMVSDANECATKTLVAALEGIFVSPLNTEAIAAAVTTIETATVRTVSANLGTGTVYAPVESTLTVDTHAIDAAFTEAAKVIGKETANAFMKHRAVVTNGGDEDADLLRAKTEVAAVVSLTDTKATVERAARDLTNKWLDHYGRDFKHEGDQGRAAYLRLARRAGKTVTVTVTVPETLVENTKDAKGAAIPMVDRHLFSDGDGNYPFKRDSSWESAVLDVELARMGNAAVIGWYRNPARPDDTALQIPYTNAAGVQTSAQPDFLFFQRNAEDEVKVTVVDPHGTHFNDGIERLRGMAKFVAAHDAAFEDFLAVAESTRDGKKALVALNLKEKTVQDAIAAAAGDVPLFDNEKLTTVYAPPAV